MVQLKVPNRGYAHSESLLCGTDQGFLGIVGSMLSGKASPWRITTRCDRGFALKCRSGAYPRDSYELKRAEIGINPATRLRLP